MLSPNFSVLGCKAVRFAKNIISYDFFRLDHDPGYDHDVGF